MKRRENHNADTDKLTALVKTQKENLQKKSQKVVLRSKSSAEVSSTLKWAPAMNDEQASRLISARAVMDYEFEKQINASSSKWQMVALKYNKKFKSNQLNFVKTLQSRISTQLCKIGAVDSWRKHKRKSEQLFVK